MKNQYQCRLIVQGESKVGINTDKNIFKLQGQLTVKISSFDIVHVIDAINNKKLVTDIFQIFQPIAIKITFKETNCP